MKASWNRNSTSPALVRCMRVREAPTFHAAPTRQAISTDPMVSSLHTAQSRDCWRRSGSILVFQSTSTLTRCLHSTHARLPGEPRPQKIWPCLQASSTSDGSLLRPLRCSKFGSQMRRPSFWSASISLTCATDAESWVARCCGLRCARFRLVLACVEASNNASEPRIWHPSFRSARTFS